MGELKILELAGTAREMGLAHGRRVAHQVRDLCAERLDLAMRDAGAPVTRDQALRLADAHLDALRTYAPETYEEFCGIAQGAGVSLPELLVGNGYTDFRDVLADRAAADTLGCTSFVVTAPATADGLTYAGQTWDMHASAEPFMVVLHRRPAAGPESLTLTTTGCLSLVGLNEHGIAIGNNNLVAHGARPGVIYLAMIHHALAQQDLAGAVRAIIDAPRASAHNYYLVGPDGGACDIETTATEHERLGPDDGLFVHANHYVHPRLQAMERRGKHHANSCRRHARMAELLAERHGRLDVAGLRECLSDTVGSPDCICRRPGEGNAATCAAAILCTQRRALWVCRGTPCDAEWHELHLDSS